MSKPSLTDVNAYDRYALLLFFCRAVLVRSLFDAVGNGKHARASCLGWVPLLWKCPGSVVEIQARRSSLLVAFVYFRATVAERDGECVRNCVRYIDFLPFARRCRPELIQKYFSVGFGSPLSVGFGSPFSVGFGSPRPSASAYRNFIAGVGITYLGR